MFIISTNKQNAYKAIESMLNSIQLLKNKKIYEFQIAENIWITWASAKPSDNLHFYNDGIIIGKLSFDENNFLEPQIHQVLVDSITLHPLLHTTVIKKEDTNIAVKQNQHCNIFYSKNSISDFQLLIAKTDSLLPSLKQVVLLGSVGYFPGNLTLFDEISKTPYLETLYFPQCSTKRHDSFTPKKCDDKKMVERLIDIVPNNKNSALALSSGLDSRFVLGILHQKLLKPKIYTLQGDEVGIVHKVCEKENHELFENKYDLLDEYSYTLVSDGRIYFRGGGV